MWAYESVFYQIYPLGFSGAPFENDGVLNHRILKVNDWIPHIKRLGADAIYFSPVFESDTHGYNTRDYTKIDTRLGTNKDFANVCYNLHNEGIKVVLDGVFNHVGRGFWAFQDVLKNRESSPYINWFARIDFNGNSNYNDGSNNKESLVNACDYILYKWRGYTDEEAFIYCNTDGEQHNTITPICRRKADNYEMDLVLRNNITTKECPWGVYHPSANLHHIKKENIGLIEVMGMAILPARLDKEMGILKNALLNNEAIRLISEIEKHAEWVESWKDNYDITRGNVDEIIKSEIGKVFVQVLECAGVYKTDEKGREAFIRFTNNLT